MFSKEVVNRPIGTLIIYLVLLAIGAFTLKGLLLELLPDVSFPYLEVSISYPGAGPEEVETVVTKNYEGVLSTVSELKNISVTSSEGISNFNLEFEYGTDMSKKKDEVRDKVALVRDLMPDDVKDPIINTTGGNSVPFVLIGVSGNKNSDDIRKIIDDDIKPELEQVNGIAAAAPQGGRERIVSVSINKDILDSYKLNMASVKQAIMGQNIETGGGSVKEGKNEFLLKLKGNYSTLEELENAAITYKPINSEKGHMYKLRLSDIANISFEYEDFKAKTFVNGKPGVVIMMIKQANANAVKTAKNVKPVFNRLKKKYKGILEFRILIDSSKMIVNSVNNVQQSALYGGLFAMLVVFIFLRSIKSTIIIGLSIPTSVFITIICMQFTGTSLNIMSLSGLALGIGMVVDSSIVILENIFAYREKGATLKIAAAVGSKEMTQSIVASTLTTIFVFLPSMIFQNRLKALGVMFFDLSLTVVISLLASLFVAMTLIPILTSKFFPLYTRNQRPIKFKPLAEFDNNVEKFFKSIDNVYEKALRITMNHRFITLGVILAILITLPLLTYKVVGLVLSPDVPSSASMIKVKLPLGSGLNETKNKIDEIMKMIEKVGGDNLKDKIYFAGYSGGQDIKNEGVIYISFFENDPTKKNSIQVQKDLSPHLKDFLPTKLEFGSMGGGGALGGGDPINMQITSTNLENLKAETVKVRQFMNSIDGLYQIRDNLDDGLPQVELVFDRQRMYVLGLSIAAVIQEMKASVEGVTASKFKSKGDEYDIKLKLDRKFVKNTFDLQNIMVTNPNGVRIPIANFAEFKKGTSPSKIFRENRVYRVSVTAAISPGYKLNDLVAVINGKLKTLQTVNGVNVALKGNMEDFKELGTQLAIIFVMSVLLVYATMAFQFESILDPFIIFSSLPLMLIGIALLYLLMNTPFSLFTGIGCVILAGIVVNNGIVFVDYTNLLIGRGVELREACIQSGKSRLRPILLTSLTTILGMLPMVISQGQGTDIMKPIAQAVVGGMLSSTFMTLFYVPIVYAAFHARLERIKNKIRGTENIRTFIDVKKSKKVNDGK